LPEKEVHVRRDDVGVAVVGCGGIGQSHASALAAIPQARLVAAVDIDAERAEAFRERFGAAAAFTDLRPALELPELDAVVVATDHATHAPLALAALEAGKSVLVQKPMARTLDEAERICQAEAVSAGTVMVSFNRLFHPAFVKAKQIVVGGALGEPVAFRSLIGWYAANHSWHEDATRVAGGILTEAHVHHLAVYNWMFDAPTITKTLLVCDTDRPRTEIEKTAVVVLQSTDAPMAEILGSSRFVEWNQQKNGHFSESIELYCTKGLIRINPTARPSLTMYADELTGTDLSNVWVQPRLDWVPYDERGYSNHFNADEDPWVAEHRHFLDVVRGRCPAVSGSTFGLRVQQLVEAAYSSVESGRLATPTS
jgi:myo-inositol 2-dehydrogenase/D-chiro-inositol 1-dehydrogenase